jgi:hypothetical protein
MARSGSRTPADPFGQNGVPGHDNGYDGKPGDGNAKHESGDWHSRCSFGCEISVLFKVDELSESAWEAQTSEHSVKTAHREGDAAIRMGL